MPRKGTGTLTNWKFGSACKHCRKKHRRCEWPQRPDSSGSNTCVGCQQAGRTCLVYEAPVTASPHRDPTSSSVQAAAVSGPQTIHRPSVVDDESRLSAIGIDAVAPFSLMSQRPIDTFRLALPLELFSSLIATVGPLRCGIHAALGHTGLHSERNTRLQSDLLRTAARPVDSGCDLKPRTSEPAAARPRPRSSQQDLLERLLVTLKGTIPKGDSHALQSEILSSLATPWTLSTRDLTALTFVAVYAPEILSNKINPGMVEATAITCTLLGTGVLPLAWFNRGQDSTYNGANHSERMAAYLTLWTNAALFDLSSGGTCKVKRFTEDDLELALRHHPELTALVDRAAAVKEMTEICQLYFRRLQLIASIDQLEAAVEESFDELTDESLYQSYVPGTESRQESLETAEFKFICIAEVMTCVLECLLRFMPLCDSQVNFYQHLKAQPRLMWIIHPLGAEQVEAAKDLLLNFCDFAEEPHSIDDSQQTPELISAFDNIASLPCRLYLTLLSAVKVVVEHDAVVSTTTATSTKKMTVMLLHRVAEALQGLSFYDGTDSEDVPRSAGVPRVQPTSYDVPKLCSVIVRGAADKCKRRMAGGGAKRQAPSTPASTSARGKRPRPSQAHSEASSGLSSPPTPARSNYASSVGYSATGAWPSTSASASAASPAFTTAGQGSSWPMMTDELSLNLQQFINDFFGSPGGVSGDGVSSA